MKSSTELLKESWSLFKGHWGMFLAFLLSPALLSMAFQYAVMPLMFIIGAGLMASAGGSQIATIIIGIFGGIIALAIGLIFMVAFFAGKMLVPLAAHGYNQDQTVEFIAIWKKALKKVLPFIWVTLLSLLVLFSGALLLIVPAIFFMVWFMFAGISNIIDNKKGLHALMYSKSLVDGRAWKIIGKTLFPALIALIMLVVFIVIGLLLYGLSKLSVIAAVILAIPVVVAGFVGMIILGSIITIYTYVLYINAVETVQVHEGHVYTIPTWLKVMTWLGGALAISAIVSFAAAMAINPQARAEFLKALEEGSKERSSLNSKDSNKVISASNGVFDDHGIKFEYPEKEGWKYAGPGEGANSIGYFVDENSKITDTTGKSPDGEFYSVVMGIQAYIPKEELVGKSAYAFAKDSFVPVMENMKQQGGIKSYDLTKETINNKEVGVINYIESTPDGVVQGRWLIVNGDKMVYIFLVQALDGKFNSAESIINKAINTLEFTDKVPSKLNS